MNRYTIEEKILINSMKSELPHICYYCGKQLTQSDVVTVDHKLPISRGGLTTKDNLVIACLDCNNEKDSMTEEEYYTYKNKQKNIQDNFEVNNAIKDLLEFQNNIINRIKEVKDEYEKTDREISYLQKEMIYNNFNASEGYLYAKKLKELLSKKEDLALLKSQYNYLHPILGNHDKQFKDISKKVCEEVYNTNKEIIKKQVIKESTTQKDNIIRLKNIS